MSPKKYLVVVEVVISSEGYFRYNILSLSGIEEVDSAVKEFLDNEINKIYPKPFDGKKKVIRVNFKPESRGG